VRSAAPATLPSVFHDPLDVFRVDGGVLAERSCESEDQVVPSLVGEQQRPCTLEELGRIGELDNVHETAYEAEKWIGVMVER
jgi:hypothetical protein